MPKRRERAMPYYSGEFLLGPLRRGSACPSVAGIRAICSSTGISMSTQVGASRTSLVYGESGAKNCQNWQLLYPSPDMVFQSRIHSCGVGVSDTRAELTRRVRPPRQPGSSQYLVVIKNGPRTQEKRMG
ncbi:hypothetical protein BDV10DRAFT_175862 [Aspergillus recurvatus]